MTALDGSVKPLVAAVSVNSKAAPVALDMAFDNGETVRGIYKFEKDGRLVLCIPFGDNEKRPKTFDGKENTLFVLEKVKK